MSAEWRWCGAALGPAVILLWCCYGCAMRHIASDDHQQHNTCCFLTFQHVAYMHVSS